MDKLNKGFTVLELLLVLSGITVISLISLTRWQFTANDNKNIDFVAIQVEAMRKQITVNITDSLYFNGNGNINQAQTIDYKNKLCVFQLGFGRFYCE